MTSSAAVCARDRSSELASGAAAIYLLQTVKKGRENQETAAFSLKLFAGSLQHFAASVASEAAKCDQANCRKRAQAATYTNFFVVCSQLTASLRATMSTGEEGQISAKYRKIKILSPVIGIF